MDGSSNSSSAQGEAEPEPGPTSNPKADYPGSIEQSPTPMPVDPERIAAIRKEKGRVRFNSNANTTAPPTTTPDPFGPILEYKDTPISKPRPSVLRGNSSNSITAASTNNDQDGDSEKATSAAAAQERAQQIAAKVRRGSSTPDSRHSLESTAETVTSEVENIPLRSLGPGGHAYQSLHGDLSSETQGLHDQDEAFRLVRAHTQRFGSNMSSSSNQKVPQHDHGAPSEVNHGSFDGVYSVPAPQQYRGSVLSQLLSLYKPPELAQHQHHGHSRNTSTASLGGQTASGGQSSTPGSASGAATPTRRKWYDQNRSQETLANLVGASARLANPKAAEDQKTNGKKRPGHKRAGSSSRLSTFLQQEETRITVHIAETLSRQKYLIRLCRALMLYGAPTHRLEEYLSMTARVLEIDGQFLYLPGCMIISFDDRSTHTTEVKIVRSSQGIDLGKLKDVHHIYKEVIHDVMGVEEGTQKLNDLMESKDKFNVWFRVFIFGLTGVTASPFSFKARPIDLPLIFALSSIVGFLQLIVAPKSNLYSNVFEVSATVLVSFLARVLGSIRGGSLFCFSALAQGGIVMLLPGYLVLSSALELQSRAIVPGSIRMVYAIIYSLFLGFGITVGAAIYGLFDSNASSATTCENPIDPYYGFIFVPGFVICISIIYQAKWKQMPVMVVVAFAGYIVNYFSSLRFSASPQIASTLGAFCVGVLANLYSRVRHGVAAATLIPAVFTQVPGGLASTGGLLAGLRTANMLTNSTQQVNGTSQYADQAVDTVVFNVAASMIQIAIGIAVGLFMSALIVYPLGKRRSGLFSF